MSDDWMERLREADGALRPTGPATGEIHARVRRSQRRRAVAVTVGVVASVAVIAVGATLVPAALDEDAEPGPAASESPTAESAGPELFDCPELSKVFDPEAAPPIEDLAEQQAIVEEITGLVRNAWTVRQAEPTALGVVALVQGNVEFAKDELGEFGVEHVYTWDQDEPGDEPSDDDYKVDLVLGWLINPAVNDVRREMRGVPGYSNIALWKDAGAVLLQWRKPVPAEIQALAGVRPDGVEVVVEGVRFSAHDVHQAAEPLWEASRRGDIDADITMSSDCGDGSGLVVGVHPDSLGGRRAQLQELFAEIAGMPVMVVPEEPITAF